MTYDVSKVLRMRESDLLVVIIQPRLKHIVVAAILWVGPVDINHFLLSAVFGSRGFMI